MSEVHKRLQQLLSMQEDFCIAKKENGKPSKWISIKQMNAPADEFFFRQQLENEIILELDKNTLEENRELYERIKPKLITAGIAFETWATQSKSYHIHIFFDRKLTDRERKTFIDATFSKEEIASMDANYWTKDTRQLVAIGGAIHYKSGKPKILLEAFSEGLNKFPNIETPEKKTVDSGEVKVKKTIREILKDTNPTEQERCSCIMKIHAIHKDWKAEQINDYISAECRWQDYNPNKSQSKIEGILGKYAKPNNKDEDKQEVVCTSFLEHDGFLFEQVIGGKFARYKEGKCDFVESIEIDGVMYAPCEGEEIELNEPIVLLPERPEEYDSIESLVSEIKSFIHEWLDISLEYEQLAAWYVLLTYVYDKVSTINYLSALGDTGTGKTRFLAAIGRLCYKTIIASGGVTVAAVKRISNKWRGTVIVDEGDFRDSDEKNELVKWFNLGFEKNQAMFNCNKEDPNKLEFYNPYCPKIIARRKQFNDQALEARCLTETMEQTTREDISDQLTAKFHQQQRELRNKLLKFRFDYYNKIDIEAAMKIDLGEVEPRIKQATRAFVPLLLSSEEALKDFKKFVKEYNHNIIEERANSYDGQIVNTIIDRVCDGEQNITSTDIAEDMSSHGTKTTERTVGRHLSALKLKCEPKKVEGKTKRVVPLGKKFLNVAKRYCTDEAKLEKCREEVGKNAQKTL